MSSWTSLYQSRLRALCSHFRRATAGLCLYRRVHAEYEQNLCRIGFRGVDTRCFGLTFYLWEAVRARSAASHMRSPSTAREPLLYAQVVPWKRTITMDFSKRRPSPTNLAKIPLGIHSSRVLASRESKASARSNRGQDARRTAAVGWRSAQSSDAAWLRTR